MGRELWISNVTGKRRRGTTWTEISDLLETGITVESIYEPIRSCGKDWSCEEAANLLHELAFDTAGVQAAKGGPILGFVHATELADGRVSEYLNPFIPHHLIAYTAPFADALKALKDQSYVFILGRKGVEGIITRADLNKPVSRMYMFSLISLLEMHLTFWIRKTHQNDSWRNGVCARRLKRAEQYQEKRSEANQELDLLECLQFCDKTNLVLSNDQALGKFLVDPEEASTLFAQAEALRNNLAHSQEDVAGGLDWDEILPCILQLEQMLENSDTQAEH